MENSSRFFANTSCRYYPCHNGLKDLNCLFCYCPFYLTEKCPGNPKFLDLEGKIIKDCTDCTFPHRPESYDVIIQWIKKENENRTFSEEIRKKAVKIKARTGSSHENDSTFSGY